MELHSPLRTNLADHRYLLAEVGRIAEIDDPIAVEPDVYLTPLLKHARRGRLFPIDGVLVRDWDPHGRRTNLGACLGARQYEIDGITFVRVQYRINFDQSTALIDFTAVARADYRRLYRLALGYLSRVPDDSARPVLSVELEDNLWKNTIGYLDEANLRRIREYGGRPKRGLLLTGPPGNGKTSACRWLWQECRQRNWEWRLVSADAYAAARHSCSPEAAVRELFSVDRRGIVFFDDMDLALRDRETVKETDDQSVFLNALDGISVHEGVAFVFTTNCSMELIDRAFKRPGRIDVVLHFAPPDEGLRRRLIRRWHPEMLAALGCDRVVNLTDGFSFAEIEELKNLLVMQFIESDSWDLGRGLLQFDLNRHELQSSRRLVGFQSLETAPVNGGYTA
jgi:cell division protease FtsH